MCPSCALVLRGYCFSLLLGCCVFGWVFLVVLVGVLGVVFCGSARWCGASVVFVSRGLLVLLLWLLIPWLGGWLVSSLVCYCVFFGGFVLAIACSSWFAFVFLLGFDLCCSPFYLGSSTFIIIKKKKILVKRSMNIIDASERRYSLYNIII